VNWLVGANGLKKCAVSVFRAKHFSPEDGNSMLLQNTGFHQSDHVAP
jgi:hypothetical protein